MTESKQHVPGPPSSVEGLRPNARDLIQWLCDPLVAYEDKHRWHEAVVAGSEEVHEVTGELIEADAVATAGTVDVVVKVKVKVALDLGGPDPLPEPAPTLPVGGPGPLREGAVLEETGPRAAWINLSADDLASRVRGEIAGLNLAAQPFVLNGVGRLEGEAIALQAERRAAAEFAGV